MDTNVTTPHVVLLATGGTIVSRNTPEYGATLASDGGSELAESAGLGSEVAVKVVDVMRTGSYALTFDDMLEICAAIREGLADANTVGVVVTHGTDTMEESAYLADLLHNDERPVVFTGAQRPADHPAPDGPANLRQAVAVAASSSAREQGVLVVFNGTVFRATGVRKIHTADLQAFGNPDVGPVGTVSPEGEVELAAPIRRPVPFSWPTSGTAPRVDVVACHPGADGSLLRAALEAGSSGIVLQATGNGNANRRILAVVEETVRKGVPIITSTRVHAGAVTPVYGAGGGKDLEAAGAIPAGMLKPAQALTLLQLLIQLRTLPAGIADVFRERGAANQPK